MGVRTTFNWGLGVCKGVFGGVSERDVFPDGAYPGLGVLSGFVGGVLRSRVVDCGVFPEGVVDWVLFVLGVCGRPVCGGGGRFGLGELGYYRVPCGGGLRVAFDPFDVLSVSGPTPLVRLRVPRGWPSVWVKLEWFNPYSLSVKDRVAREIVGVLRRALESGRVRGVVEASSGNTGVALAALASLLGVEARVLVPESTGELIVGVLGLLGARVERSGSSTGELVPRALREALEGGLAFANQVGSDFNFIAHVRGTGREIIAQLEHARVRPTAFVAGSGTGGTAGGVGFTLYNYYYRGGPPRVYSVVPREGERIEGLRRGGGGWLQRVGVPFETVEVSRGEALEWMVWAARRNGLVVGVSSGAVLAGIGALVREGHLGPEDTVVAVFPDTGFKYPHAISEALDHS